MSRHPRGVGVDGCGEIETPNRDIEAGQVMNQVGVKLAEPVDEALVNESGTRLYPCYGGLPSLLIDESIIWESS